MRAGRVLPSRRLLPDRHLSALRGPFRDRGRGGVLQGQCLARGVRAVVQTDSILFLAPVLLSAASLGTYPATCISLALPLSLLLLSSHFTWLASVSISLSLCLSRVIKPCHLSLFLLSLHSTAENLLTLPRVYPQCTRSLSLPRQAPSHLSLQMCRRRCSNCGTFFLLSMRTLRKGERKERERERDGGEEKECHREMSERERERERERDRKERDRHAPLPDTHSRLSSMCTVSGARTALGRSRDLTISGTRPSYYTGGDRSLTHSPGSLSRSPYVLTGVQLSQLLVRASVDIGQRHQSGGGQGHAVRKPERDAGS